VTPRSDKGRKLLDLAVKAISLCAALLGIFFLGWMFVVIQRGIAAVNWQFFTKCDGYRSNNCFHPPSVTSLLPPPNRF
jgi:uncharacterized membrane protein (Fun14 family)